MALDFVFINYDQSRIRAHEYVQKLHDVPCVRYQIKINQAGKSGECSFMHSLHLRFPKRIIVHPLVVVCLTFCHYAYFVQYLHHEESTCENLVVANNPQR